MEDTSFFEIRTGPTEVGWCDFSVRLGEASWNCHASYIGEHPLRNLIHSAVDLYHHIFEIPIPAKNAIWDCWTLDEPGGIVVRAIPEAQFVRVQVFQFTEDQLWPDPKMPPQMAPSGDAMVDYWDYAGAVLLDASRSIARQGITGLRNGWQPAGWDIDFHGQILPTEHFLYLAALVSHRAPRKEMSLKEEITILEKVAQVALDTK